MTSKSTLLSAILNDPMSVFGAADPMAAYINSRSAPYFSPIQVGVVEQFNVGMYSALVTSESNDQSYICFIGTNNATQGFGYSDSIVINEGDRVIFACFPGGRNSGVILSKVPTQYSIDETHPEKIESDTELERRTHFFSHDCYRKKAVAYDIPLTTPDDVSTGRYLCNRPTDLVPGETGQLNQHRNGFINSLYSTTIVGGGAHIRLFSLENKIRIVADSIVKHTFFGNETEWHNRRYLSRERASCIYQEERLGMDGKGIPAFEKSDYHEDGYFIKNKKKKQTLVPRIMEYEGYFGGLSAKYHLRPDPDSERIRTMDEKVADPGVARESVDPSGQYRLAATGMLGFERIGRIPVPVRVMYPWHKDAEEPPAKKLGEFKHNENNPYYRQLELADRVAFDLKNSYSRFDESKKEFYVPEEKDLENKLEDVYDPGFTDSKTINLEKYDKRRSGLWQGEDGSIIIRDAWGSEIVMIGGNIQLSCAGNVEILPGKSALTFAGDDIVQKAQNSIDIESADKDLRLNAFKNVQIMAGIDEEHPGGITLEANGKAYPWDGKTPEGGEQIQSTGIVLKSKDGNVVTDVKYAIVKANKQVSIVAGEGGIEGGNGNIMLSADNIYENSCNTMAFTTNDSALLLSSSAVLIGDSALVAGKEGTAIFSGDDVLIPLMWASTGTDIASEIMDALQPLINIMKEEEKVAVGYNSERLENMIFKFRSSQECSTETAWELQGPGSFKLFEPFWVQVHTKFETLKSVSTKEFEDHKDSWGGDRGHPWPGTSAVSSGKYAKLAEDSPVNMDDDGFNKPRNEVQDSTPVTEIDLFPGYLIRD